MSQCQCVSCHLASLAVSGCQEVLLKERLGCSGRGAATGTCPSVAWGTCSLWQRALCRAYPSFAHPACPCPLEGRVCVRTDEHLRLRSLRQGLEKWQSRGCPWTQESRALGRLAALEGSALPCPLQHGHPGHSPSKSKPAANSGSAKPACWAVAARGPVASVPLCVGQGLFSGWPPGPWPVWAHFPVSSLMGPWSLQDPMLLCPKSARWPCRGRGLLRGGT